MPGWTQILIVVVLVFLLFGRGKITDVMGDFAKGIKSFKKGLADDEKPDAEDAKIINHDDASPKVSKTESTSEKVK